METTRFNNGQRLKLHKQLIKIKGQIKNEIYQNKNKLKGVN